MVEDFKPRNYQTELMKIALKKNTIIYLPTGSGKTFIALLVLKGMSRDLKKSYDEGGKISIILVNTVALVEQHAKYVEDHTDLPVGKYSGDMNVDFWPKSKWYEEFNKYRVFVMTCQILVNIVNSFHLDLNKVNLLIFDECHRGVNDQPMRQIMKSFSNLLNPPRILGLTATLLNGNCNRHRVMQEVEALETTFHSKVATVEGLAEVVGFSTNPQEYFKISNNYSLSSAEMYVEEILMKAMDVVKSVQLDDSPTTLKLGIKQMSSEPVNKKIANLFSDCIIHIKQMGSYSGILSVMAYMIRIERIKRHCQDSKLLHLLQYSHTIFQFVKEVLNAPMKGLSTVDKILKFSSHKVLQLFEIFEEFKTMSKEELCSIIFVDRRTTAQVVYHILKNLSETDDRFSHIKPNFVVGFNSNPYNETRETLFLNKQNRKILENFKNKEINVLVSSNVLEEGVDIPKCTLVIKYDKPNDYRSYIQSKGRARHQKSIYYIILEQDDKTYSTKYNQFEVVEKTLNDLLIGNNEMRPEPSTDAIQQMYDEDELPPYYANGPGSAQVTMVSAIPLLYHYCSCLPSDIYTNYTPEWYVMESQETSKPFSVCVMLPTVCPLTEIIQGEYMQSIKSAKKAAALKACVLLHQKGELDDHLLPKKNEIPEENVNFLFTHYPQSKEKYAGNIKTRRLHNKKVANYVQGQIQPDLTSFVHVIELQPRFPRENADINNSTIFDIYTSSLCFAIITPNPLPIICKFPIYVTLGTIDVILKVNETVITLSDEQIYNIRRFQCLIYGDVLKILQKFLIFNNSPDAEMVLIVPYNKDTKCINFNVLRTYTEVKEIKELTLSEKIQLDITQETYLHKIVTPWYRIDMSNYIVTEVCFNKNAFSDFPSDEFSNFKDYFNRKHCQEIINPALPLLLVKGLTKHLNFIKPKGMTVTKKKREKQYEELIEHLIPELIVKQELPAPLWIQANLLPTILNRITFCLQLDEIRSQIARDTGLGLETVSTQMPLELDSYLLDYNPYIENEDEAPLNISSIESDAVLKVPPASLQINNDFAAKKMESQYPWKDIEEPKDIERNFDITVMDIEIYDAFCSNSLRPEDLVSKNNSPQKKKQLALTYYRDFIPKNIKLLEIPFSNSGPNLCEVFRAFTAAKANEIVNSERLETLGDSFLKLISSVYIALRFPKYDEGKSTTLKNRLVSNRNLYYLAIKRNLNNILKYNQLSPKEEWLPPGFTIPNVVKEKILEKELSIYVLFNLNFSRDEQIFGYLNNESLAKIAEEHYPSDDNEDSSYTSMAPFFSCQYIGDKYIADVVESVLGVYFESCGFIGGIKFIEWIGIIPESENLIGLIENKIINPLLNPNTPFSEIERHLPTWENIECILGYNFKNKGYLLQALTHSSYSLNRVTLSYEKLEFLGDAILDFLITCYIYESCGNLNPGQLTDLRSALVNNNTFASLLVRCSLHKYILLINTMLQMHIDKFVEFMEQKNFQIDDDVLILLEENELHLAEYVDVPKVLGDVFEALVGAIYLDCGKDLNKVWSVVYKIMWKEISLFSQNVPKNIVRRLFEWPGAYPKFGDALATQNKKTIVPLQFMLKGTPKIVHGCGTNKNMAKKAAAKLAARFLQM